MESAALIQKSLHNYLFRSYLLIIIVSLILASFFYRTQGYVMAIGFLTGVTCSLIVQFILTVIINWGTEGLIAQLKKSYLSSVRYLFLVALIICFITLISSFVIVFGFSQTYAGLKALPYLAFGVALVNLVLWVYQLTMEYGLLSALMKLSNGKAVLPDDLRNPLSIATQLICRSNTINQIINIFDKLILFFIFSIVLNLFTFTTGLLFLTPLIVLVFVTLLQLLPTHLKQLSKLVNISQRVNSQINKLVSQFGWMIYLNQILSVFCLLILLWLLSPLYLSPMSASSLLMVIIPLLVGVSLPELLPLFVKQFAIKTGESVADQALFQIKKKRSILEWKVQPDYQSPIALLAQSFPMIVLPILIVVIGAPLFFRWIIGFQSLPLLLLGLLVVSCLRRKLPVVSLLLVVTLLILR